MDIYEQAPVKGKAGIHGSSKHLFGVTSMGAPFNLFKLAPFTSDAAVKATQAFALDTSVLSDAVLKKAGLERKDTDGSDHLPIVVDVVPVKK